MLNGHPTRRAPGILSVSVDGVEGESLLYALPGLAVVLRLGLRDHQRRAVLRAAGARAQRPAGAELAAAEPRPLQHGRATSIAPCGRSRAAVTPAARRRARERRVTADDPRYGAEVRAAHGEPRRAPGTLVPGRRRRRGPCRRPGAGRRGRAALRVVGRPGRRRRASGPSAARTSLPPLVADGAPAGPTAQDLRAWDWREAAAALEVPPAKFGRLLTLQDAVRAAAGNWPGAAASTV